jgi:hypothetical protein
MKRSTPSTPKKRGRPATGRDPLVSARLRQEIVQAVDKWANRNKVSRSEALRKLVELGLKDYKKQS